MHIFYASKWFFHFIFLIFRAFECRQTAEMYNNFFRCSCCYKKKTEIEWIKQVERKKATAGSYAY